MKKAFILILFGVFLVGCTPLEMSSYDAIIGEAITSDVSIQNTYRKGYKFYLPKGLNIEKTLDYNEVIKKGEDNYYLYIDIVGYLNKDDIISTESTSSVYYKTIEHNGKNGYVRIKNLENGKYLVEIVYNYAKIEVIVDEENLKSSLADGIIILSSISYNDSFLNNLSEESLLSYKEEMVDIFHKDGSKESSSNFLQKIDELDTYQGEDKLPDLDMIKGSDWDGIVWKA